MEWEKDLVSVNILNTNERKYLGRCLSSVIAQTYPKIEITLIDNGSTDGSVEFVKENFPQVKIIENNANLYYCAGHNRGINQAKGEFILILNVDIFLEPDFVEKLVEGIKKSSEYGAAQAKIYNFVRTKEDEVKIIDTVGIVVTKSRRNFDLGQGMYDYGQFDQPGEVFGADGAAPLYRRSALEKVKVFGEYFDEDFLIYREEVDLSWRLQMAGYKTVYVPEAKAYHIRGFSPLSRKRQSNFIKQLSYRNRLLTIVKNDTFSTYLLHSYRIIPFELAMLFYILIKERHLINAIIDFIQLLPRALAKRREFKPRIVHPPKEIIKWFV